MKSKGFTLLETLVAIAILAIGTAGPIYMAARSLTLARNSANRMTASFLASEGIELARQARDEAYLTNYPNDSATAWSTFLPNQLVVYQCSGNGCYFSNTDKGALATACGSADCKNEGRLYIDSSKGTYTTDPASGAATPFYRYLKIDKQATYIVATCTVTWQFQGQTYTETQQSIITYWL